MKIRANFLSNFIANNRSRWLRETQPVEYLNLFKGSNFWDRHRLWFSYSINLYKITLL